MKIRRLTLLSLLAAAATPIWAAPAISGWDDDDDIYYNPSSKKDIPVQQPSTRQNTYVPNTVVNYPAADTYTPAAGSGLNVDIDQYNRHGQFLVADSTANDTTDTGNDTFAYTRRLERFYNSDIVNGSGDQDLIDYYYAEPATSDVNIYVVNASPWSSWYTPSWYWNSWYYPYNYYGYGWYDPWYSWSWGWRPSWGWGPSWGPAVPPHPGINHGWASVGSSRPHAPATGSGSASTTVRRPGSFSAGASSVSNRPGNLGRGRTNGTISPSGRPASPSYTPATTGNGNSNNGTFNRGRNNNTRATTTQPGQNTRRQDTSPSYNSGNSSRGRSTGGFGSGGGSRSTHGTGGGGSTGGGRGRR
ncbi:MAG: hypothetical protein NC405_00460 [Odoribacter sp.]|nr:hypothetical protein [Odoribacter sp.]